MEQPRPDSHGVCQVTGVRRDHIGEVVRAAGASHSFLSVFAEQCVLVIYNDSPTSVLLSSRKVFDSMLSFVTRA